MCLNLFTAFISLLKLCDGHRENMSRNFTLAVPQGPLNIQRLNIGTVQMGRKCSSLGFPSWLGELVSALQGTCCGPFCVCRSQIDK